MSKIQKYIKKQYEPGGAITLPPMNFAGFETNAPQLAPQQPQQKQQSGFGQMMQNFSGQFSGDFAQAGFEQITGGQGVGDLFKGAMSGEGPGAGIMSSITEGIGSGGGLDIKGLIGKASGGGGFDPMSMIGSGLDTIADDNDATTYKATEIGADAVGAAMGVGRIMTGDVIGGGKQLLGEVVDIGQSVFGRKKARKDQVEAEGQARDDYFSARGGDAQQRVASNVMSGQMDRASNASEGMTAMQEKYSQSGAKSRGTIGEKGARIKYDKGGLLQGTRPEDLKYTKEYEDLFEEHKNYKIKDYLNPEYNTDYSTINKHFDDGGRLTAEERRARDKKERLEEEAFKQNEIDTEGRQFTANMEFTDYELKKQQEYKDLENEKKKQIALKKADMLLGKGEGSLNKDGEKKLISKIQEGADDLFNYGGDALFAGGATAAITGVGAGHGSALMTAGTAISAVPDLTDMIHRKIMQGGDNLIASLSGTGLGNLFGIDEDYQTADFSKYTGKKNEYKKNTDVDPNVVKGTLLGVNSDYMNMDNAKEFVNRNLTDASNVLELAHPAAKSVSMAHKFFKGVKKGEKYFGEDVNNLISNVKDSFGGSSSFGKEYTTGGVTQGEFSHKKNPLTVVDKQGNDTGMELTGGEGVFDNKAMTMLDKYKNKKDYSKAGKLVFKEMESWINAGTAKKGMRIKYK